MPEVDQDVIAIMNLHQRCRNYGRLPFPGSILEQPEWVLDAFDSIESAKSEFHAKEQESREMEMRRPKSNG